MLSGTILPDFGTVKWKHIIKSKWRIELIYRLVVGLNCVMNDENNVDSMDCLKKHQRQK